MNKVEILTFVANFFVILGNLISYAIIARIIMSWFTMGQAPGRIAMFLRDMTEPVMKLARKIPHRIGMMDLSPIIALLGIDLLTRLVFLLLSKLAQL